MSEDIRTRVTRAMDAIAGNAHAVALLNALPREVANQWVLPYALENPVAFYEDGRPAGRWSMLLHGRPLSFWQGLRWSVGEADIAPERYCERSFQLCNDMLAAKLGHAHTPVTREMDRLDERIDRASSYFDEHGTFPIPPVLLQRDDGLFILDGHHRICAYWLAAGHVIGHAPESLANGRQRYFIAQPAP